MELIRTLTQLVNNLRSLGIRRRVAVVCPNDPSYGIRYYS